MTATTTTEDTTTDVPTVQEAKAKVREAESTLSDLQQRLENGESPIPTPGELQEARDNVDYWQSALKGAEAKEGRDKEQKRRQAREEAAREHQPKLTEADGAVKDARSELQRVAARFVSTIEARNDVHDNYRQALNVYGGNVSRDYVDPIHTLLSEVLDVWSKARTNSRTATERQLKRDLSEALKPGVWGQGAA